MYNMNREDIPQEVIDEISSRFTIDWSHYGEPQFSELQAYKIRYYQILEKNVEGYVLDTNTWKPKKIIGTETVMYMIRGLHLDNNVFSLYTVMSGGPVLRNDI